MSNEEMRLWKLELERRQKWLKTAKASAGTRHQVPSIKQQIEDWKKQKPKSGGGSSRSGRSSSSGSSFTLNPLVLLWRLIKLIFRGIWSVLKGILKG